MRTVNYGPVIVSDSFIESLEFTINQKGFKYDKEIKEIKDYVPKFQKGQEAFEPNKECTIVFSIEENEEDSFKEYCYSKFGCYL